MFEAIRRHLLKAVAAILAGALVSVIWDIAVKPALIGLSGLLMIVGTLGIATLRDNVYVEVARGLHEDPSITLVAMALGVLGVILFFLIRSVVTETTSHADFEPANRKLPDEHFERIWQRKGASNAYLSGLRRKALGTNVVLLILCTILLARLFYINRAIVHFRQCFDAASPYLSEQEEEEILGQFSSMQTRAEFVTVTTRVEDLAHTHGKRTPEFTIW